MGSIVTLLGHAGIVTAAVLFLLTFASRCEAQALDLSKAAVVVRSGERLPAERAAADVLVEEIAKRTGLHWPVVTEWPAGRPVIALTVAGAETGWGHACPALAEPLAAEGYCVRTDGETVWVLGADGRGVLYGVGRLLR
ncbi:MAG: hypothetical protein QG656_983, partial [Candidatus Hydrogenedentes bacterium]|nr:hypothetical protein [Candidatus Hydrogenedentota bacterium]